MKKSVLIILGLFVTLTSLSISSVAAENSTSLKDAIGLYKARNYSSSYTKLTEIVKKDPSNSVACYYLALSASKVGKKDEAIDNYNKVLTLSNNYKLKNYAQRGLDCETDETKCSQLVKVDELEEFVSSPYGSGFSNQVRGQFEKSKIENLMREMNRRDSMGKEKFKDFKDFSSQAPSNDEIAAAMMVLQRAGFSFNNPVALSSLTPASSDLNNDYDMVRMLTGAGNDSSLSPQVIQSLLTNRMSVGF